MRHKTCLDAFSSEIKRQSYDRQLDLKFRIGEIGQMNSERSKKLKPRTPAKKRHYASIATLASLLWHCPMAVASALQEQVDTALTAYVQALEPSSSSRRNEGSWQKLDTRLNLPVCSQSLDIEPFSGKSSGRTTLKLSCETPAWSLLVPVHIRSFQKVVVAKSAVTRNALVTANVLALEEREIKHSLNDFFVDPALVSGRLAKRAINADQIITAPMLANPDVVSKGQSVIIEATSGNFAIRTAGEALTNGGLGDTIRVRNAQSGRLVEGTVVSEGKVRIAL